MDVLAEGKKNGEAAKTAFPIPICTLKSTVSTAKKQNFLEIRTLAFTLRLQLATTPFSKTLQYFIRLLLLLLYTTVLSLIGIKPEKSAVKC